MPVSKINGVNINWRTVGDRGQGPQSVGGDDDRRPARPRRVHPARRKDRSLRLSRHAARPPQHRRLGHPDRRRRRRGGDLDARHACAACPSRTRCRLSSAAPRPARAPRSCSTCNYPQAVRGLLLLRVTGGPFAAGRLPEQYYGQFIRAAKAGRHGGGLRHGGVEGADRGQSAERRHIWRNCRRSNSSTC